MNNEQIKNTNLNTTINKNTEPRLTSGTKKQIMNKTKNIYQKIAGVQSDIGQIIRDEFNKFQKYPYFEEFQILSKIKPLLEKYGIMLMVSDDPSIPVAYEKNGDWHYVKYLKKIEIVDVDTEKSLTFSFWAMGQNTDLAKAKGASETYAMKYLLTKFFLMPVKDKSDPDYNNELAPTTKSATKSSSQQETKKTVATESVYTCMKCKYPKLEKDLKVVGNEIVCLNCL